MLKIYLLNLRTLLYRNISILLVLLLVCCPLYCQSYTLTEQEMTILEQTLKKQEMDLTTALNEQQMLLKQTEQLKTYCDKLEREASLNKYLMIGGLSVGIIGLAGCIITILIK